MGCNIQHRRGDLRKIIIFLAPERSTPGGIQRLDIAIFIGQPCLEGIGARRTKAQFVMAVAQFIINLPACNVLALPVMFCHGGNQ